MDILLDTNILLRLTATKSPGHTEARGAVQTLRSQGNALVAAPQNFVEAWNVATRPIDRNGLGLTIAKADRYVRQLEQAFTRLIEPPDVYDHWRELVVKFKVSGVQVHDARLVAVLLANGLSQILTFNAADFLRFESAGIRALDPRTIGQPSSRG